MLSNDELQSLRQIEAWLSVGDPRLAAALSGHHLRCWVRYGYDLVAVLAALGALLCLALSEAGAGPAGLGAAGLGAVTFLLRRRRFPTRRRHLREGAKRDTDDPTLR